MMFTIFDIIIFAIIAVSTIMGLYKGLLGIAINIVGFVASIVTAIFLFPYIKLAFTGHIENELLLSILSGTVSYVCSLFILTAITSRISSALSFISGGVFDRALGAFVGFLRGLVISTIIFTLIAIFSSGAYLKAQNLEVVISNLDSQKYPTWLINSKTSSYLEKMLRKFISFLPENALASIKLPNANMENDQNLGKGQDVIDNIKNRKEKDSSSVIDTSISIDKDSKDAEKDLIDNND
jgi:uncharacterized membrane protein required for colicin V production